jgi:hypothetical protein
MVATPQHPKHGRAKMSEPAAREKPDFIEKIADYAGWILAVSVAVIITAYSLYFFQFRGSLSDDTAIWGQFGDFVGGTLNSVFAFFGFLILLISLRLQARELAETRAELEMSRKAQEKQLVHMHNEERRKYHAEAIEYFMNTNIMGNINEYNVRIVEITQAGGYISNTIKILDRETPAYQDIIKSGKSVENIPNKSLINLQSRV